MDIFRTYLLMQVQKALLCIKMSFSFNRLKIDKKQIATLYDMGRILTMT